MPAIEVALLPWPVPKINSELLDLDIKVQQHLARSVHPRVTIKPDSISTEWEVFYIKSASSALIWSCPDCWGPDHTTNNKEFYICRLAGAPLNLLLVEWAFLC